MSAIIVDTVEAMSGMEGLVVFGVGLDKKIEKDDGVVRCLIYKAMTRAHLTFNLINEHVGGGWLEWIQHAKLTSDGNELKFDNNDKEQVWTRQS